MLPTRMYIPGHKKCIQCETSERYKYHYEESEKAKRIKALIRAKRAEMAKREREHMLKMYGLHRWF
jgi:hypothetical protein